MLHYRRTVTEGSLNFLPIILGLAVAVCLIVAVLAILPFIIIAGEVMLGAISVSALLVIGQTTRVILRRIGGKTLYGVAERMERPTIQAIPTDDPDQIPTWKSPEITRGKVHNYVQGSMVRRRKSCVLRERPR